MVAEIAPGPGDQRDGERKDRDVADAVGLRHLGALLLPVLTPLEDHLEGDEEEQHAAGDAKGVDGDAEDREDAEARDGEEHQDSERGQRGADGDLRPLGAAHAGGQRQEDWRETRRVDGDEERHEGGEGLLEHGC